jgi:hypothetical protein
MRPWLLLVIVSLLFFTSGGLVYVFARQPLLDREWDEDVRVLAGVRIGEDGIVHLQQVRDWSYSEEAVLEKPYFDATFDPADIVDTWMYEQKLDRLGLIAHTFIVFEFDQSYGRARYLGLSVETRREVGEQYSIIGGMLRSFEVTHIWATERDLVRRRVEFLDYPLTRYRLLIPEDFRSQVFLKFVQETADLAEQPRWYNTALNNCTSSLIRYVNESQPGAIPIHYSFMFTGKTDEYLQRLGYLDRETAVHITKEFLESNELR